MKLKAHDTLHVSSVRADNIKPGEEFEVSDDFGRQFVERGLATEVVAAAANEAKPDPVKDHAKADAPPLNKMDAPQANKSPAKPLKKGR